MVWGGGVKVQETCCLVGGIVLVTYSCCSGATVQGGRKWKINISIPAKQPSLLRDMLIVVYSDHQLSDYSKMNYQNRVYSAFCCNFLS